MQKYQYQHGDRPLDGYTIQRAAGRGGFGEVYYAVSDGGREVALKAVQNYEQIELRGISHCMNLKSPHLVTVFDVKYNDRNEPFVIMEYVSGPSLHDLLSESPQGLGIQKAAFFTREIAKSLSFLHECGIVHRDLKPSNIFYENGYVKVGDYGLAKAISASRHSGHTITVGTVHYMAPEIGAGSYNRSIDIYALGVLLYEMLTGDVPFVGSSPAEILMKHMTSEPDLGHIEEPFARVIKKAMAKDPAERYQTVQEMVEDLFGSEHIRDSVSHFSPDELSVVAERIAAKANIVETPRIERPRAEVAAEPTRDVGKEVANAAQHAAKQNNEMGKEIADTAQRFARQADAVGQKVADRVDAEAGK
ncbi:MAG: serine/threonine protein kinase, partial [Sedimentisphaerales bacterium]|nr:serine/threonine protein kinase [Sedimentisphaerales bacterium]